VICTKVSTWLLMTAFCVLYDFDGAVAGEFIGEYAGEIISKTEVDGERAKSEYLWDLGEGLAVDAQRLGNATRRINHSDTPNVRAVIVNHRGIRKVCMYARASIAQGAELSVDYGAGFKRATARRLV
jgi:SET domain-containing protein